MAADVGSGRCRALNGGAGQQLTGSLLGKTVLLHITCLLLVSSSQHSCRPVDVNAPALGVVTF